VDIVINGYYGFGNVGDEIILSCMLKELETSVSRKNITVLSKNPEETENTHLVNAKDRWNIREVVSAIRKSSIFISGGGTLFQDITSSLSPYYYLSLLYLAQRLCKKTFIYAQGMGPLKRALTRYACRQILDKTDIITVRDKYSLKFLYALGVEMNNKKVYLTADPAWTLFPYRKKSVSLHPKVGIILRRTSYYTKFDVIFWRSLLSWLKNFLSKEIYVISFRAKCEKEFICENFRDMDIDLYVNTSITETIKFVDMLDIVLSTRLHGLILGLLSGAAVFGFCEDVKIYALLDEFGIAGISYIKDTEPKSCAYKISKIYFEEWREYSNVIEENINQHVIRARLAGEVFRDMLRQYFR
jgi:polysaccharide pyruvyl transferase CsaB